MNKPEYQRKAAKERKKIDGKLEAMCAKIVAEKHNPLVVDVGAWQGVFLDKMRAANPNALLVGVEPITHNTEILRKKGVRVITAIVAKEAGIRKLFISNAKKEKEKGSLKDASIVKESSEKYGLKVANTMDVVSIIMGDIVSSCVMDSHPHIDLLFMNCEGAEYEIFEGPIDWLEKVDNLYIHLHTKCNLFLSEEYINKRYLINSHLLNMGFKFLSGMEDMRAPAHIVQLWSRR